MSARPGPKEDRMSDALKAKIADVFHEPGCEKNQAVRRVAPWESAPAGHSRSVQAPCGSAA
jgi:hypothetical protein